MHFQKIPKPLKPSQLNLIVTQTSQSHNTLWMTCCCCSVPCCVSITIISICPKCWYSAIATREHLHWMVFDLWTTILVMAPSREILPEFLVMWHHCQDVQFYSLVPSMLTAWFCWHPLLFAVTILDKRQKRQRRWLWGRPEGKALLILPLPVSQANGNAAIHKRSPTWGHQPGAAELGCQAQHHAVCIFSWFCSTWVGWQDRVPW